MLPLAVLWQLLQEPEGAKPAVWLWHSVHRWVLGD
jgi:hypothetical protein